MSGELAPVGHQQFFHSDGMPLASGWLITSQSGGATPLATYSDVGLTSSNGTTIELNGAGRPSVSGTEVALFLDPSKSYRFTLKDSSLATLWTCDNIGSNVGGTYTPTTTNVTNMTSSTPGVFQYMRVGNVVTVSGRLAFDPAGAGGFEIGISLPIASNLTNTSQLAGNYGVDVPTNTMPRYILGDITNDRASLTGTSAGGVAETSSVIFMYLVA